MRHRDHEMGKWDRNPPEPREPFLPDEMLEPTGAPESPSLVGLHMPKKPLNVEGLKGFLIEIKPFIEQIQSLSRQDQHKVGSYLQEIKNEIHFGEFSEELAEAFEKVAVHFSGLLLHSAPIDQQAVLDDIQRVESML